MMHKSMLMTLGQWVNILTLVMLTTLATTSLAASNNVGQQETTKPAVAKQPLSVNRDKNKAATKEDKTQQKNLDQGLVDAQIDDVLNSPEFAELERSNLFTEAKAKNGKMEIKQNQSAAEPEKLLKQLDESDLMDYVADDDLWKEQLTIEDEPG